MILPKEFHLKDFPADRIRVLFNNNEKFIDDSIKYFGSLKELADFLSVSSVAIQYWKKLNLFIPLQHIKKIVDKRNIDWHEIESNVVAYKGPNSSLIIQSPKLPIIETPELFAIIAHLIGDGSVNKNNIPFYINSNKELINNFQKLISLVFGNIKGKVYKRKLCYEFRSSRVIVDLIKHFYEVKFNSLDAELPNRIKDLPDEFSVAVIRAFADDEGSMDLNHRINIYSRNLKLLLFVRELLTEKLMFKNVSPVLKKSKLDFYLSIKPKDLEKYSQIIGFNHPLKSIKLSKIIETRNNSSNVRRKDNQTRNEILSLLSSQNFSTEEIILKLGIRKSNVNVPLKELYNKGLISKFSKKGQTIRWAKMEE